jgi:hypothetical protein
VLENKVMTVKFFTSPCIFVLGDFGVRLLNGIMLVSNSICVFLFATRRELDKRSCSCCKRSLHIKPVEAEHCLKNISKSSVCISKRTLNFTVTNIKWFTRNAV